MRKELEKRDLESREPETTDRWMDHISEFAHKWELGTPEHCAVNDFLNLQNLYRKFGEAPDSRFAEVSGESGLSPNDRADRDIQKIALLESAIERDSARIPGYSNAYVHMTVSFEDLLGSATREAGAKYPDNIEMQKEYVNTVYRKALEYAEGDVFEKQNPGY
jgi:hypothetical protein